VDSANQLVLRFAGEIQGANRLRDILARVSLIPPWDARTLLIDYKSSIISPIIGKAEAILPAVDDPCHTHLQK